MGTVLQVTANFIGQAFAILLVVLRDDFLWSLTAITLAYFFPEHNQRGLVALRRLAR